MSRRDDYLNKLGEIAIEEVKQQLDETPLVPQDEENKDLGDYQFRPLTRKEKKEFFELTGCQRSEDIGRAGWQNRQDR